MSSAIARYSSLLNLFNSSPVNILPSVNISSSEAMAAAVSLWSPVIIITLIPAVLHFLIASFASFLGGSIIPISPLKINSFSTLFSVKLFLSSISSLSSIILYPMARTLNADWVMSLVDLLILLRVFLVILSILPLLSMYLQVASMISGAPFVNAISFLSFKSNSLSSMIFICFNISFVLLSSLIL